jgi:DNA polymerase I
MIEDLFLIDGYGVIYQSYYAFVNRPLTNPQGKNTQAVFGFFRFLLDFLREKKPRACAVIMDSKTKTHRHRLFAEYKAHREAAPQELYDQIGVIEEILTALGVPWFRVEGFEADDLLSALAARCRKTGVHCYVVTRDKDLLQIVGDNVSVLRQRKGESGFEEWHREEVFAHFGVYPEQMVDYLALIGDASDNIPGVAGIGPKSALKLLSEYKTLDAIYENLEKIPETMGKKLAAGRESAHLSRELAVLPESVPFEAKAEAFILHPLDAKKAAPLFIREGIKSIARDLEKTAGAGTGVVGSAAAGKSTAVSTTDATIAGQPGNVPELASITPGRYATVTDEQALRNLVAAAAKAGVFAFDSETDGLDDMRAQPVGFSLSVTSGSAAYIPVAAMDTACLPLKTILSCLKPLLEDPNHLLIGQNIKFDYKILKRQGISIQNRLFDTMIAAWLLESEAGPAAYSLDLLAEKYLSYRTIRYEEAVGDEEGRNLSHVPVARATDYAAEDADIALRLSEKLDPQLRDFHLESLFFNVEMPVVRILAEMEAAGIRVLPDQLKALSRELETGLAAVEKTIYTIAGKEFNINSPKQLQSILFVDRKLMPLKKTKTGFSTDNQVLESLAFEDELAARVVEHRSLAKLKNTYADTLPELINPATGRIHTQYLQTGTATGRLSCKDPNLQNIPVREETGRLIRRAFVPAAGSVFISADYSQIELAVLAHLSADPLLMEAFRKGTDVHALTASLIFNRSVDEVSTQERRMGKTINFGVIYGMSGFRLAQDFKISRKEASDFIDEYFNRYAGVRALRERTLAQAEKDLFVSTLLGRRRRVPGLGSANKQERAAAERAAFNTVIQGSASDIVKTAMRDIARFLKERGLGSRLLLQVHDELVLETPEAEVELVKKEIRRLMEQAVPLSVPLRVTIETGLSWGDIH